MDTPQILRRLYRKVTCFPWLKTVFCSLILFFSLPVLATPIGETALVQLAGYLIRYFFYGFGAIIFLAGIAMFFWNMVFSSNPNAPKPWGKIVAGLLFLIMPTLYKFAVDVIKEATTEDTIIEQIDNPFENSGT